MAHTQSAFRPGEVVAIARPAEDQRNFEGIVGKVTQIKTKDQEFLFKPDAEGAEPEWRSMQQLQGSKTVDVDRMVESAPSGLRIQMYLTMQKSHFPENLRSLEALEASMRSNFNHEQMQATLRHVAPFYKVHVGDRVRGGRVVDARSTPLFRVAGADSVWFEAAALEHAGCCHRAYHGLAGAEVLQVGSEVKITGGPRAGCHGRIEELSLDAESELPIQVRVQGPDGDSFWLPRPHVAERGVVDKLLVYVDAVAGLLSVFLPEALRAAVQADQETPGMMVQEVALSNHEGCLLMAVGGCVFGENMVQLWDVSVGKCLCGTREKSSSRDELLGNEILLGAVPSGGLLLASTRLGAVFEVEAHGRRALQERFRLGGRRVFFGQLSEIGEVLITMPASGGVDIRSCMDGRLVHRFAGVSFFTVSLNRRTIDVVNVAEGRLLLAGPCSYGKLSLLSAAGQQLWEHAVSFSHLAFVTGQHGDIMLAIVDDRLHQLRMWNLEGEQVASQRLGARSVEAFATDGKSMLAIAQGSACEVMKLDGTHSLTLEQHAEAITALAVERGTGLIATASYDETVVICDAALGQVRKTLQPSPKLDRYLPWVAILALVGQVSTFAFGRSFPWNKPSTRPMQLLAFATMLDIQWLDFQGSHVVLELLKLLVLFAATIAFVGMASRQRTMLIQKCVSESTDRKAQQLIVLATSQLFFIPILQTFVRAIYCPWVDAQAKISRMSGSITCFAGVHLLVAIPIILLLPVYLYIQFPYLLVGGDLTAIRATDVVSPSIWPRLAELKFSRKSIGFFQPKSRITPSWGHPVVLATVSELALKIAVAISSVIGAPDTAVAVILVAILQRLGMQLWRPMFEREAANLVVLGAKACMLWTYVLGAVVLWIEDERLYSPAIAFYFGEVIIVVITFRAVVRACKFEPASDPHAVSSSLMEPFLA